MAKKAAVVFTSWEQVNEALKALAKVNSTINTIEIKMNEDINALKAKTEAATAPLFEEKKRLEENIEAFTKANVNEFKEEKTKKFYFGEVGFRKSSSIITRNVTAIIEALKNNRMFNCIITKESINKEELEKYDDASLEKVGAKRKTEDKFFYKVYEERIEA